MATSAEILCSRCGTPFPQERGKTTVTCVVCGQLRPDLDMTLDEDEEGLAGAFGAAAAAPTDRQAGPMSMADSSAPPAAPMAPAPLMGNSSEEEPVFRVGRNYVSMGNDFLDNSMPSTPSDSLWERIGPVLLIIVPLAAGMGGALNMLQSVPDFSKGTWYAVGTVFLILLIGSFAAGSIASGLLYSIRIRWTFVLRIVFLMCAAGAAYIGLTELPRHIQVRDNDLPAIMLRR